MAPPNTSPPLHRRCITVYRGRRYLGEFWVESGDLHLVFEGRLIRRVPYLGSVPSEKAEGELWRHLQEHDAHRPRFNWYRLIDEDHLSKLKSRRPAGRMDAQALFGILVAATLGIVLLFALLLRVQEGRCQRGGFRNGLDCSYPAPAKPGHESNESPAGLSTDGAPSSQPL